MSYKTLGELVKIKGGKRLPKGAQLQSEPNSHPYIRVRDMGNKYIPENGLEYVPDDVFPSISRYIVKTNDVIISIVGTIGLVSIIDERFDNASQTENCAKLSGLDYVDANYLYYFLSSSVGQQEIRQGSVGAVQAKLPLYSIEKIKVYWPERCEREEIVNHLATIDRKLDLNVQTNQTLEEMAQAIFKSWFIDFDPVKAKMNGEQPEGMDAATASLFPEKLVESELGLIPEGWDVLPSEKVATVAIGKTPPRKEPQWFSEDRKDVTWISIRDMGNTGTFALDSSEYLTQEAVDKFNVKVIPDNTLILSFKLTVGRVAITHGEMTTNEAIAHYKLSDNARVSTNYLYSYMKQFNFESLGSTSSIAKAVNSKIIKALPVIVPSKEILGSFDSLVKPLFDKIKSNQIENQNLEDLRDTLLPKLLSGEIELGQAQELAEVE
ncbi:TPA: restriction endonuclease subunit S [Klebsiella pneumoniae]|uniref:restriction endonuclease subunit S n=1 Tax=Escherichia coli TaxID=562 RepID=UPI00157C57B6|nr:restriction endonuclease subunit S [Escherichia coli]NUC69196.1 restriction endonuclease subunit S [Escherichia coli]HEE3195719.1 restriction endonuclease subunit S [Klebsiella pneumoniae]HEE3212864.1 restriction endonuclease subunit S [Klebsiella pneumoniae]